MEITPDNLIVENKLDKETDFVSRFYTPHSSIGELSRKVLESIQAKEIRTTSGDLEYDSLGYLIQHSKLLKVHPNLKRYFQIIFLEVLSIEIAIDYVPELRELMDENVIKRVRENIKYTLDVISLDPRFTKIIEHLQNLEVDLGYIEAQVPVIKKDGEGLIDG